MGIFRKEDLDAIRMDGITVIITGCNCGIGKATAQAIYKMGAKVIMACRNVTKAQEALNDIVKECEEEKLKNKTKDNTETKFGELIVKELDLSSLASVRKFAEDILNTEAKIQLLINNAGVAFCPKALTEDGFEMQFGTNHLGHFLLTILLLPKLIASGPSRIVNVASRSHIGQQLQFDDLNYERRSYSAFGGYQQSKLANVLFTKELAKRLQSKGITTYSLNPGFIVTEAIRHIDTAFLPGTRFLMRHIGGLFAKTPLQGSLTTLHCALSEEAGKETGLYYDNSKVTAPGATAHDEASARKLWEVSLKLVGIEQDPYPLPE